MPRIHEQQWLRRYGMVAQAIACCGYTDYSGVFACSVHEICEFICTSYSVKQLEAAGMCGKIAWKVRNVCEHFSNLSLKQCDANDSYWIFYKPVADDDEIIFV